MPIGKAPSHLPNIRISISPNQNTGTALNRTARTRELLSKRLPRRTADKVPTGIPMLKPSTSAVKPSCTVAPARCFNMSMTGRL